MKVERKTKSVKAILFLGVSLCVLLCCSPGQKMQFSQGEAFQVETQYYSEMDISIFYPVISGLNDTNKQDNINALLKKAAFFELDAFSDGYDKNRVSLSVEYKVSFQENNYLCVNYYGYIFAKNTPYARDLFSTVTLDLQEGVKVNLEDIVRINESFVETVKNSIFLASQRDPERAVVYEDLLRNDDRYFERLLRRADSEGNSDCSSFLGGGVLGISFATLHAAGDHFEIELPIEEIRSNVKNAELLRALSGM